MTGLSNSWSWKGFIYCGADRADMYKSSFGAGDLMQPAVANNRHQEITVLFKEQQTWQRLEGYQ